MKYEIRIVQENKYGGTDDINGTLDSFDEVQMLIGIVCKAFPKSSITASVTVDSENRKEGE